MIPCVMIIRVNQYNKNNGEGVFFMASEKHQSLIDFENEHGRQLRSGMRVIFAPNKDEGENKKGLFKRMLRNLMEEHYIVDRLEIDNKTNEVKAVLKDGLKTIACSPALIVPALPLELEKKIDAQRHASKEANL